MVSPEKGRKGGRRAGSWAAERALHATSARWESGGSHVASGQTNSAPASRGPSPPTLALSVAPPSEFAGSQCLHNNASDQDASPSRSLIIPVQQLRVPLRYLWTNEHTNGSKIAPSSTAPA